MKVFDLIQNIISCHVVQASLVECYYNRIITDRWISDTAEPVCVLIVLEVLVAVVQSI